MTMPSPLATLSLTLAAVTWSAPATAVPAPAAPTAPSTAPAAAPASTTSYTLRGRKGLARGKHVVLVSGDEEYRSEEALPMLCQILAVHHGWTCTVLFAIDPATGAIDPGKTDNVPGTEALDRADLLILATRFRRLPPAQMAPFERYVAAGKPIIGLRTATHAFAFPEADSPYARWHHASKVPGWEGGFGRRVLGETWVAHHGAHGKESTHAVPVKGQERHPILRGVRDVWGPTDVYKVNLPLPGDSLPLLEGLVVGGMRPVDAPIEGPKNQPPMPVAWTRTYAVTPGKRGRVFTTTMGAAQDLANEGLRRLIVNAALWAVGLEAKIPSAAKVDLVVPYEPTRFKFGGHRPGRKPSDLPRPPGI
jgi:hypothetical protein